MSTANGYVSGVGVGGLPGQASSAGNGGNGLVLLTAFAPCAAGSYFATSVVACLACPVGTYSYAGAVSLCLACAVNTYASGSGSSACVPCLLGYDTASSTGASGCKYSLKFSVSYKGKTLQKYTLPPSPFSTLSVQIWGAGGSGAGAGGGENFQFINSKSIN